MQPAIQSAQPDVVLGSKSGTALTSGRLNMSPGKISSASLLSQSASTHGPSASGEPGVPSRVGPTNNPGGCTWYLLSPDRRISFHLLSDNRQDSVDHAQQLPGCHLPQGRHRDANIGHQRRERATEPLSSETGCIPESPLNKSTNTPNDQTETIKTTNNNGGDRQLLQRGLPMVKARFETEATRFMKS